VEALEEVAAPDSRFLDTKSPQGLFDKSRCCQSWQSWIVFPESVKDGDCKEVIHKGSDINLFDFDFEMLATGRRTIHYVSSGIHEKSETGKRNVGMYRMQVYD